MSDVPETVDLNWIGRRLVALQDNSSGLRSDMDMLVRMVVRLDNSVNALREDVRAL